MSKPLPCPPTLKEMLAGPVVLNLRETCRALRMSESWAYVLLAKGTFPVPLMDPDGGSRRRGGVPLRFSLADVLSVLGFDFADVLREIGMDPAVPSPAREEAA